MPDVPADTDRRFRFLCRCVDRFVGIAQAVGPEHLPCQEFRILQHQTPEGYIVSVHRTSPGAAPSNEAFQLGIALLHTLEVNASLPTLLLTELAEAGNASGIASSSSMHGPEC